MLVELLSHHLISIDIQLLVMHPLLVHASSPASRTTLAQSEDGRWACVKHGIRVTFNLSTLWRQPPLRR